jgi:hypothetical protein
MESTTWNARRSERNEEFWVLLMIIAKPDKIGINDFPEK